MAVRNRIREHLEARTMSQSELARRAGLTRVMVTWLVAGRYIPKIDSALRIARVLDVSVEEIWELEGTGKSTAPRTKRAAGAG